MKTIKGVLDPYFETGTEGIMWSVYEDGKQGYEGLNVLEEGDELTIYDEDKILFHGRIEEDTKSGWTKYDKYPGHGQPSALGYWIHWTQKGYQPDDWARLFFHGQTTEDKEKDIKPYRAVLIKKDEGR